jgi:hypothetical protein
MTVMDTGFRRCDRVAGGRLGNELLLRGPNGDFPETLFRKEPLAVTSSDTNP